VSRSGLAFLRVAPLVPPRPALKIKWLHQKTVQPVYRLKPLPRSMKRGPIIL
jgi:hypothetical protein